MKLSKQEKTFLTNLYRKMPDTYIESTKYAIQESTLVDIRDGEIKNRAVTDLFEEISIESTITSASGKEEKKEWMKGTIFIKVKVWQKLCKSYIEGFKKAVLEKRLSSSDPRYTSIGMKGGIDAAIEYVQWVNKNNIRLNEKYKANIPQVDVEKEKTTFFDKLTNIFKK